MKVNLIAIEALALVGALAVVGCAGHPVATFTGADASNAATMAKGSIDPNAAGRMPCYAAWANLATGVSNVTPGTAGVFTVAEGTMEAQYNLQVPACQAIAGQIMMLVISKGAGLVPGV